LGATLASVITVSASVLKPVRRNVFRTTRASAWCIAKMALANRPHPSRTPCRNHAPWAERPEHVSAVNACLRQVAAVSLWVQSALLPVGRGRATEAEPVGRGRRIVLQRMRVQPVSPVVALLECATPTTIVRALAVSVRRVAVHAPTGSATNVRMVRARQIRSRSFQLHQHLCESTQLGQPPKGMGYSARMLSRMFPRYFHAGKSVSEARINSHWKGKL
jgi:hypothetical protein